jgi:microcin C transport system permease protein
MGGGPLPNQHNKPLASRACPLKVSPTMLPYLLKRLALIVPTLFGILLVNFLIVQAAPGGPVEQVMAQVQGVGGSTGFAGGGMEVAGAHHGPYRGGQGLEEEFIAELRHQYGFDKPLWERFTLMLGNYVRFDFGESFFSNRRVLDLVLERLPVSLSLGLWSTLVVYLVSIPLGIAKAVRDGSRFDIWSSFAIVVGYAVPSYLFAIALIILFAGGDYLSWFPLRGLVSDTWQDMPWPARIVDYLWHMALPVTALVIGGFASLTMLTKNSFIDEIGKQYVLTATAKGASSRRILYGHVFRNAMLIIIAGFPAAFIGTLFTGALLIEVIFSLDGLGLLGFEAAITRDYPVVFGTLYIFTLLGLVLNLINDLMYTWVDPRIDFGRRG